MKYTVDGNTLEKIRTYLDSNKIIELEREKGCITVLALQDQVSPDSYALTIKLKANIEADIPEDFEKAYKITNRLVNTIERIINREEAKATNGNNC